MKRLSLLVILVVSIISCQVTERFYLNEDGSVLEEKEIDLSAVLAMMDSEETGFTMGELSIDTIVDATTDLKSILPSDSQSTLDNSEELRKHMDKSKFHIILNEEQYIIKVITETANLEELNAYNQKLGKIKTEMEKQDTTSTTAFDPLSMSVYTFKDNTFGRQILGGPLISKEQEEDSSGLGQGMADAFVITLEYHFPQKIKSSSLRGAEISEEGTVMTFTDELSEILEYEEEYKNFTITFE